MSEPRVQRRLAAILAADVVGYSRLMGQDETGTLIALKSRRKEILSPTLAQHGGRLIKVMGDGVLVEFASAVDAVQCAIELQAAFAAANEGYPTEKHIVLRIGINLGDVIVEGEDLYGDGVNVAARLEGLAEPGGIVISDTVQRQIAGKSKAKLEDLGSKTLKNIVDPLQVYRVYANEGSSIPHHPSQHSVGSAAPLSVAVLPFQNMSGDPEQEYFADGMVEDIITALSRFKLLFVIARNSSFIFKGQSVDIKKVGRELGVNYVLEGSVRRSGPRLRITAQLIETSAGKHVWADKYDAEVADLFDVQETVARTIATILDGRIAAGEVEKVVKKPTASWKAYDYFLQGRNFDHQYNPHSAADCFARAIALDPRFSQAYAYRAITLVVSQVGAASSEIMRDAEECANRAILLDPADSVSHQALGYVALHQRKFDLAGIHLNKARALNSNDTNALADLANWFARTGKAREALDLLEEAMHRDPFPPAWAWLIQYRALFHLEDYKGALAALDRMSSNGSTNWREAYRAAALAYCGDEAAARTAMDKFRSSSPNVTIASFAETEPYSDSGYCSQLMQGLRKAGLPE
jgi:TolB-like protein